MNVNSGQGLNKFYLNEQVGIQRQIRFSTLKWASSINYYVLIKWVECGREQNIRCAVQTCLMAAHLPSLFANWFDKTISVIYLIPPELAKHLISICSSSGWLFELFLLKFFILSV